MFYPNCANKTLFKPSDVTMAAKNGNLLDSSMETAYNNILSIGFICKRRFIHLADTSVLYRFY